VFISKKWFIAPIVFIFLFSCSKGDSPSDDYLNRLANVLEVDKPESQTFNYPSFPTAQSLVISSINSTISIREFLGLRQCKLHLVIAERNSQIGKVASPSQRLKNDLDILAFGPQCLTKIQNKKLKDKLASYLEIKRKQVPANLAQAILMQAEYRAFWQIQTHKDNYPDVLPSASVLKDLVTIDEFVSKILNGEYLSSDEEFSRLEIALGNLRYGDAGQLLSALTRQYEDLLIANEIIGERLARPLCLIRNPTTKALNLQNVVNRFFIENVQAQSVKLNRRYQQLMPVISRLEIRLLPYANEAFNKWVSLRRAVFDSSLTASKQHVIELQKLYVQCGLTAGNANL